MAEFDLKLFQTDSGADFQERTANLTRGGLFTASADANRTPRILAAGTENQILAVDANGDLVWVTPAGGHTQNTDSGTTGNTFTIDSDSALGKMILDVALGAADKSITITNAALTDNRVWTFPDADGTIASQSYADGLFASNDAMLFKGTIGSGGTHEISAFNALTTYNAGWTYRVKTAGTIRSIVCEIGDIVTVLVDRAGTGNLDSDFTVIQTNLDGSVIGPASVTDGYLVQFDGTTGKLIKAGSGVPGSMVYETATNYVAKALFDAYSILYATSDNTPAALTVGEQTIVGRITGGAIAALTPAQIMSVIFVAAPASKTASGTEKQMAWDDSYLYLCVGTDSWKRTPIAFWS